MSQDDRDNRKTHCFQNVYFTSKQNTKDNASLKCYLATKFFLNNKIAYYERTKFRLLDSLRIADSFKSKKWKY